MGIQEQLLEYFKGEGLTSGLIPGLEQIAKEASAKGRAEGLAEGFAEGFAEGKTEAIADTKEIVMKNMITKLGLSDQQVMDVVEVNISYVKRIRKSLLSVQ